MGKMMSLARAQVVNKVIQHSFSIYFHELFVYKSWIDCVLPKWKVEKLMLLCILFTVSLSPLRARGSAQNKVTGVCCKCSNSFLNPWSHKSLVFVMLDGLVVSPGMMPQ